MEWKGRGVVAFMLFVYVCMYVCIRVYVCVYDDLSAYLTKGTFSRFLSLLFLFLYLANQSTYLPTYLPHFLSRNLFFENPFFLEDFFFGMFCNRIVPISDGII